MITFHKNPLDKDDIEIYDLKNGSLLYYTLKRLNIPKKNKIIYVNNKKVTKNIHLNVDDNVHIYQKLTAPAVAVVQSFLASTIIGTTITVGSALYAASTAFSVFSAIAAARKARQLRRGLDSGSAYANNQFVINFQEGEVIPVVYGEHKVTGTMIERDYNSSTRMLDFRILVSQGEIESIDTDSIKVNGVDISTFSGVAMEVSVGAANQAQSSFSMTRTQTNSLSYGVRNQLPPTVTDTPHFSTVGLTSSVNLDFCISGSVSSGTPPTEDITVNIYFRVFGSGATWTAVVRTLSITINANLNIITEVFTESVTFPFQNRYEFFVTYLGVSGRVFLTVVGLTEHNSVIRPTFRNRAVLSIRQFPTASLQGFLDDVTMNIKGKKVLVPNIVNSANQRIEYEHLIFDGESYVDDETGETLTYNKETVTFVEAWTRNPIWIIADIVNNARYGVDSVVDEELMNLRDLFEAAEYCDELEGAVKRYTLDLVIDSSENLESMLSKLMLSIDGFFYFSQGRLKIGVNRDPTQEDYVQSFNDQTILGNEANAFNMSVRTESSEEAVRELRLQYVDKDFDYANKVYRYCPSPTKAVGSVLEVRAFTTELSQAMFLANRYLIRSNTRHMTVSFEVDYEAILCEVGDIVAINSTLMYRQRISRNIPRGRVVQITREYVEVDMENSETRASTAGNIPYAFLFSKAREFDNVPLRFIDDRFLHFRTPLTANQLAKYEPYSTKVSVIHTTNNKGDSIYREHFFYFRVISIERNPVTERYSLTAVETQGELSL